MKVGLLGYGNIAKKHEAALARTEGATVSSIFDIEAVTTANGYSDLDAFLASGIDVVTICTPNGLHKEHTLRALNADHHVICEKPLSLNVVDCTEMIETARARKKHLFCTMQNRYSPVSQWLKDIIGSGALGELYLVNVACYWNRNKGYYEKSDWRGSNVLDGGTLFTQFSHYVDTLSWLFGDMDVHSAHFRNFDHDNMIDFEDTGVFNFSFKTGGMGTFSYTTSCYEKNFESSMALIGSKGTIKVAGQYMDTITYCNLDNNSYPELANNDNLNNISLLYKDVKSRLTTDPDSYASVQSALKVVEIIESVYSFK